jgi:hypothetical protein
VPGSDTVIAPAVRARDALDVVYASVRPEGSGNSLA